MLTWRREIVWLRIPRSRQDGVLLATIGDAALRLKEHKLRLHDGFGRLGLEEIVSYAVAVNAPSRRVMERIGMTHHPAEDFDHQDRKPNDPLRRYVVYRRQRGER